MSGYRRFLPDATELIRELSKPGVTLEQVGSRYGVSRQAVHKAIRLHEKKQVDQEPVPAAG